LIIALLLVVRFLQLRRKNAIAQLQIVQLKKDEADAQILLKEEMLKRSELEKYEAMLKTRFKEQEIEALENQFVALTVQKEKLEEQIVNQTEALKKYETQLAQIQTKLETKSISGFLKEIKQLIRSKLGENSRTKAYLQKIERINDAMLIQIDMQSEGQLSPAHLRYCVCFIIGMSIKDIAACFCVEISSIHTVRSRLKHQLKLDQDADLDDYFSRLP